MDSPYKLFRLFVIFLTVVLIAGFCAAALSDMSTKRLLPANESASKLEQRAAGPEKVMAIVGGIGNTEAVVAIEEKVNAWLKDHDGKVEITGRTQSGDNRFVIVMIWYKDKTD